MNRKSKWLALTAMLFGGSIVFQISCLEDFWSGFAQKGWPTGNRFLNIALDVLNEELFG